MALKYSHEATNAITLLLQEARDRELRWTSFLRPFLRTAVG